MTDSEYAVRLYCLVFHKRSDDGDADIQGIFDALGKLPERERAALEKRYRGGKKFRQIGADFGLTAGRASEITNLAYLRFRQNYRTMSKSLIEEERVKDMQRLADIKDILNDVISEFIQKC